MYSGLAGYLAYVFVLLREFGSYFFVPDSSGFTWGKTNNIWHLTATNLPQLSDGGKDLVNLLVPIFQNLMTYWAEASTPLPTNLIQP